MQFENINTIIKSIHIERYVSEMETAKLNFLQS